MSITAITTSTKTRSFFLSLLNKATTLSHISQIQSQLLHHSLHHDLSTTTKLTHKLFDLNATRHALSVFFSFPNPDIFLVNVLIKGLAENNQPGKALSVFRILRKEYPDLKCNSLTYTFVVAAASLIPDSRIGYLIHCNAIVDGVCSDLSFGSAVIAFYFKVWREDLARKVFDNLPQRDTVVCNTMISGYARSSFFTDSVRVFNDMLSGNGPFIDCTSVIAVLPAVAELVELRLGMGVHCLALKSGFHSHLSVTTGLISLYTKCGEIETARFLFNGIGRKDVISCNAMISGFTCNGDAESSVRLFIEWLSSGGKVNSSTIVGLIPVYSPFGHLRFIECIHGFSVKFGVVLDSSVSTALTTVYSRLNEIESARQLFDESKEKTLASWNAMISGYTQNGLTERAISLFHEMLTYDINPNPVTVTSILSACSQLGTLSLGKWIHHSLVKSKSFESNVYVLTALIDMYAKCGSIEEARRLFDAMTEKNEVTWNAMIAGYGLHGHGNEALKLYYDMLHSAIRPTSVTFLTILYACSHAGLVSEGDEIFCSIRDYGLEPLPEHYACMVDILGRAGQLDEALEFIKGMPSEPGPQVWGALLGSCMIHKNTNIARIASDRLFELDPSNMGYYVLMSNIYSTERNYPQAASVRQVAKRRNLAKTPGCTLIEVGQTPHVFTSGDQSHPQSESIYSELDALNAKMYDLGYQPETATALHDVEEEEKELMVKVHSEKLAIAFGLISTEPGSEIRIIKNLRVCLDCHTATKFISKITKRVIVVRDANRFHHFKDGVCSCGDYW